MKLQNYTRVKLLTSKYENEGITTSSRGYIIEVYDDAYEVEFSNENGETIAQIVVKEEDVTTDERQIHLRI